MEDVGDGKKYNLSSVQLGISGAVAGFITRFLVQPLDVLKIRFQLQITHKDYSKYTSVPQAIKTIRKEEGVFALWKGHLPAQYLSVFFGAVQFSTYDALTSYFHSYRPYPYPWVEHLVNISSGAGAGVTAVVISFPFDVIRTHLVFQGEPKIYRGTLDAARKIYKNEGLRGFTKGLTASCIQTAPMSGLMFSFHEMFTQCWMIFVQQVDVTKPISTTGSMLTGLLAGLCAKTVVYPCDLIKKRLQIQGFDKERSCQKVVMNCKGVIHCLVLTIRHEGFLGLFKGFTPSLIKAGATTSIYFTIYDKVCQFMLYTMSNQAHLVGQKPLPQFIYLPMVIKKPKFVGGKETVACRKGKIPVFAWKDKRIVISISTYNEAGLISVDRNGPGGELIRIQNCRIIIDYPKKYA